MICCFRSCVLSFFGQPPAMSWDAPSSDDGRASDPMVHDAAIGLAVEEARLACMSNAALHHSPAGPAGSSWTKSGAAGHPDLLAGVLALVHERLDDVEVTGPLALCNKTGFPSVTAQRC